MERRLSNCAKSKMTILTLWKYGQ